jgi:hypothetical protein
MIAVFVQINDGLACSIPRPAQFEYNREQAENIQGTEKLRYFIGEVVLFSPKSDAPEAWIRVMRDYGSPDHSRTMVTGLPKLAVMKVKPAGGCTWYDLKQGDIGVFAAFEENDLLWLAWKQGPAF